MNEIKSTGEIGATTEALLEVIVLRSGNESEMVSHRKSHPHVVHVYSEVDERDHAFCARESTRLSDVVKAFRGECGIDESEFDLFKCEASGKDVSPFFDKTIREYLEHGHCPQLVWIFANRVSITVKVNNKEVTFHQARVTGSEIKGTAIKQGVAIQPDFCLFVVKEGRQEPVKDAESIRLHAGQDFDAVDPDHCS